MELDRDTIINRALDAARQEKLDVINAKSIEFLIDKILDEMRTQYVVATRGSR